MSIRKNFKLKSINIDINQWKHTLRIEMEEEIKTQAIIWLKNAISIVPVWSRASHATFGPLADAVGFVIPTQPLIAKEDRSFLGESVSRGGIELTDDTFHFIYETNLEYLAANEFLHVEYPNHGVFSPKGLRTPTPYNFTARGEQLFTEQVARIRLPNPFNFLRVRNL